MGWALIPPAPLRAIPLRGTPPVAWQSQFHGKNGEPPIALLSFSLRETPPVAWQSQLPGGTGFGRVCASALSS